MNKNNVYSSLRERIALDNLKSSIKRRKKVRSGLMIAATAATALLASFFAVKTISNRNRLKENN